MDTSWPQSGETRWLRVWRGASAPRTDPVCCRSLAWWQPSCWVLLGGCVCVCVGAEVALSELIKKHIFRLTGFNSSEKCEYSKKKIKIKNEWLASVFHGGRKPDQHIFRFNRWIQLGIYRYQCSYPSLFLLFGCCVSLLLSQWTGLNCGLLNRNTALTQSVSSKCTHTLYKHK